MSKPPRVSVIVTNYNHGRYLEESITQIVQQTRPADELIIVDDASTDNSAEIISGLVRKHPFIRAVFHEQNQGVNRAVNRGVAESTGEYFTALGADDPLFPYFLEKAMDLCAAHPQSGFCCGEYQSLFPTAAGIIARAWNVDLAKRPSYFSPAEIAQIYRRRCQLSVPTAPALWRRRSWEQAGQLQPKLGWLADWFAALVVMSRQGACYIPDTCQSIRVDPKSHQRAGQADHVGLAQLLGTVLGVLEEPGFADARSFFQIPSVLSRFGFKILRVASHNPAFTKYLSGELIRNAVLAEGITFSYDIKPLRGASSEQLANVTKIVLASHVKALHSHVQSLLDQGQLDRAQEFCAKALSAAPDDATTREMLTAIETEIVRRGPSVTIAA